MWNYCLYLNLKKETNLQNMVHVRQGWYSILDVMNSAIDTVLSTTIYFCFIFNAFKFYTVTRILPSMTSSRSFVAWSASTNFHAVLLSMGIMGSISNFNWMVSYFGSLLFADFCVSWSSWSLCFCGNDPWTEKHWVLWWNCDD